MTKFTDEDTTVWYNDKPVLRLNSRLLKQQKITKSGLTKLKELHVSRMDIEDSLQTCRPEERRLLLQAWTDNQMLLQRQWGFPEDIRFHKFWEIKGCECPKMDNDDKYPFGSYWVDSGCPIHGDY